MVQREAERAEGLSRQCHVPERAEARCPREHRQDNATSGTQGKACEVNIRLEWGRVVLSWEALGFGLCRE